MWTAHNCNQIPMFMKQEIYENHFEVMIIFLLQEEQSHCHGTMSHSIISRKDKGQGYDKDKFIYSVQEV